MSLEETVDGQVKDNMSLIERIGLYVPLYKGYKEKNLRRDEDRAIRQEVARTLKVAKNDLEYIHVASLNRENSTTDIERVIAKVDMYYISIKKAVAGYSGWHASVKILEKELDGLVSRDAKLMDGVVVLRKEIGELVQKIDTGEKFAITPSLRCIERQTDQLIEDYNNRESVIKGLIDRG